MEAAHIIFEDTVHQNIGRVYVPFFVIFVKLFVSILSRGNSVQNFYFYNSYICLAHLSQKAQGELFCDQSFVGPVPSVNFFYLKDISLLKQVNGFLKIIFTGRNVPWVDPLPKIGLNGFCSTKTKMVGQS